MSTNVGEIDLSLILNSDKFKSQLNNIDKQANTASSKISSSLSKIGKAAAAAFSITAVTKFGKECLKVATETSNAWIGLNSILTGQGKSFNNAKSFIQSYVADGLVPLNNAVAAYKNLSLRGYNEDQIQKTMTALKNSATFARQSTYSLGEAVQTATEGLKNENSVVVDNAGVTKNVAKMWDEYAASIGTTANNLTQQQKIQAEVNGILEETKFQSNDAAIYTNTYSGKVAQLSIAFTNMKTAIGNVIQPIAKLIVPVFTAAANAVTKLFTAFAGLLSLFGLKADSVETVSDSMGDLANTAGSASDAMTGAGDSAKQAGNSAKKAGKDAKKAQKDLAGFDEIDKLSDNSNTSSGDSGGSGGGGTGGNSGITDKLDVTSTVQQDTSMIDGLLGKLKELANIFKEGFQISFGDTNFDGILQHLNGIKKSLIDIWTDPDVVNSAKQWVDTFLYSLGQMTGAIARIGTNVIEGFVGSIDKYLSQNVDRIKTFICKMFDISSEDMALTGNLWQALGEISDVLKGDTAKQIGADIIAMFTNPLMSLSELFSKFVLDVKGILFQPIIDNAQKLKETFENILQPIQTVTGTLAEAFTYVGDKANEVYDNYIHPFMESVKMGLSDTFGKFLDVFNQYIMPFLTNVANGFASLWEEHLKPVFDKLGKLIGSIAQALQAFWEGILKPLIDWVITNILPVLVPIFESLWNTIKKVFGAIADTIGGIIDTFRGLIDFIVGVFTGDWDKAWEGIKTFFSGIWDAIKGIVSAVWEAIKGIVETAINIVKGIIETVLNAIKSLWNTIWGTIKTVASTIWEGIKSGISNAINGVKDTISNALNAIKNIWSNIWNGLKNTVTDIFNGIWNTIKGVINSILSGIERMANGVISGINAVARAMNKLKFNIPDWVPGLGGKQFGFNIPTLGNISLPRLAQGGFVKANTPQLAVIGDNKTQGEFVAPEDKMLEMVLTALKMFKNQDNEDKPNDDPDVNINVILDGEVIQRISRKRSDRLSLATNGRRS